jgi:hypothetical protein
MKHFLIVTSIILLVSLPFFYSSIENAQDGSFNDYEYLQKMRRTHNNVNNDDKNKGWQDNGIFKPWFQQGTGSENDKALNDVITISNLVPKSNVSTNTQTSGQEQYIKKESQSKDESKDENKTNLLPYLLLGIILLVILIIYIKYKYY